MTIPDTLVSPLPAYQPPSKLVIAAVAKLTESYDRLRKAAKFTRHLLRASEGETAEMTRTELNHTETFLSRQADGREFLGAHLQGPLTKHKRWLVQFITNTFPNRLNLHLWKKTDSNL